MITSEQYWIDRAEQEAADVTRTEKEYLKRLKGSYGRTSTGIKKEIDGFYGAYADKEGITYAQATKNLSAAEQRIARQSASEIADKVARGDAAIKKDLEAYAKKRQINRLDALDIETRSRLAQLGNLQNGGMDDVLTSTMRSVYEQNLYTIQQGQGVGVQYGRISDSRVNAVLKKPWNGSENYSQRLWNNKKLLADTIKQELSNGIIAGRSNAEIASIIAKKMNSEYMAAERLVRTEMTRIATEADMAAYEDSGIKYYEYLATLDDRTSDICGELDGQHFLVEEMQEGLNAPPMHPNCRSTTVAWFGADLKTGLERRAKNVEGGKVPADMTFSEWKKIYNN